MTQPNRLADAWTEQLIKDHARNMAELRASGCFKKYGAAAATVVREYDLSADEFRAAPFWGNPL